MKLKVRDWEALRTVVSFLVTHLGGGKGREAARALGVSQPLLSILKNPRGDRSGVSQDTVAKFRDGLRRVRAVRRAVLGIEGASNELAAMEAMLNTAIQAPTVPLRLHDYEAWRDGRLERLLARRAATWTVDPDSGEPRRRSYGEGESDPERAALHELAVFHTRKELVGSLVFELTGAPELNELYLEYINVCDRNDLGPERLNLGLRRVVEPLVESADAGFIERAAGELSHAEWLKFAKAGLTREIILARRAPDAERAHLLPPIQMTPQEAPTPKVRRHK